jgi:Tol biopolymer transport system component
MRAAAVLLSAAMAASALGASTGLSPPDAFITIRQGIVDPSGVARQLAVSQNGRFVAFVSRAPLVEAATRGYSNIYVLDRGTGQVTLESAPPQGCRPGQSCGAPRLSGDGRFLTFETTEDSPANEPPRGVIVLKDRRTGTMRRIGPSPSGIGSLRDAAISADGRVIVFAASAPDVVPGDDANGTGEDVYSLDVASNRIQRLSVDSAGRQPSAGASFAPAVSGDARYVAFSSTAALDGVRPPGSGRPPVDVFLRDTVTQSTKRISAKPGGGMTNGSSYAPSISGDGRYVVFVSDASDLVKGDNNRATDIFLYDTRGAVALVSRSHAGRSANGGSTQPAISADGSLIVFQSDASDLACGPRCQIADRDINLVADVFAADRATGAIWRISTGRSPWMEPSLAPAIDGAGTVIAFSSRHPCHAQDDSDDFDLFVGGVTLPPLVTAKR